VADRETGPGPGPGTEPATSVLCSGTLRAGIPFTERVAAANAGGFGAISLWGRDYADAHAEGLRDEDIRLILADHGVSVAELDPAWWWPPGAADVHVPAEFDASRIFAFGEAELFAVADAVGARSLNAVDVFGGDWTLEQAADAFAGLCRRAAEHGLLVHLEFLPWSNIPDLATAWGVVRDADQPNGGLTVDAWHYFRSGSDSTGLLRTIPGGRILGLQLCDAPATPEADFLHATLHERLLPGQGELDLAALVADLHATATDAPFGVEVFSDSLAALPSEEAGRQAGAALRQVLDGIT
jgi:sugar phosphate isomerase/epimerase